MPPSMPPIDVPLVGRSGWIAIIALLHIPFFVNFVMGAPVLAVISEYVGLKKNDPRYDRFARHLSHMLLVTVGVGAFGGVGLVASNLGLFPRFFSVGANAFFWPLLLELPAFLVEAIFIAVYRYTWDRLAERRGLHMLFGLLGAFGAWGSGFIVNGLATFMLTPGRWVETGSWLHAWFNPTMLPAYVHRSVAAFSITAFFTMLYALWMGRRAGSEEDRDYAAWALGYAGRWAVVSTALQFFPGVWYMIKAHQGTASGAPEGSVIPKLLGGPLTPYWFGGIIIAAAAILVVWFTAAQNPQASLRGLRRWLVTLSVLMILVTTAFMGFTRERSRKPYLIYGVMYGNQTLVETAAGGADAETAAPDPGAAAAGKTLFGRKCAICHSLGGEGGTVGPALDHTGDRYDWADLKELLRVPPAGMPPFVGSDDEREAIGAFLFSGGEVATTGAGGSIFQQKCAICHSLGGEGGVVGPALDDIGAKHDAAALEGILLKPAAGMPPFGGSDAERKATVDFLLSQ